MRLALRLAKKADPFPNPRVGAVLVKDKKIIGKGYHKKPGMPHAEIQAMRNAKNAKGATLYVTLEPCSHKNKRTPPCTGAIIAKGIKKVIYAMKDPNPLVSGAKTLKKAGIIVKGPTDQKNAESINKEYCRKPFVAIKMAMSADGKTATRTGNSKWISSKESRGFVHMLRSEYDAVMVGEGTIERDNPQLTSRIRGKNPVRIIVDGRLKIPLNAKVLANKDKKTIIAISQSAPKKKIEKIAAKVSVIVCGKKKVELRVLMRCLGAMGIKKILIEGGSELNASAMEAGIVDKLYLFIAPKIIGGKNAKGVIGGEGAKTIKQARKLRAMTTKRVGNDLLLEYRL